MKASDAKAASYIIAVFGMMGIGLLVSIERYIPREIYDILWYVELVVSLTGGLLLVLSWRIR